MGRTLDCRLSQALHTYGTGAVANFPDLSLVIASPDINNYWGKEGDQHIPLNKIEDQRLSKAFGIDYFVQPPLGNLVRDINQHDFWYAIKANRFPNILQCKSCEQLFYINEDLKVVQKSQAIATKPDNLREGFKCPDCNNHPTLTPVRFIIATEDGHLDDFPWDWYAHKNKNDKEFRRHKRGVENPNSCYSKANKRNLKLVSNGAALSDMRIVCTQCNASESLGQIFDQDETFINQHDNYLWFANSLLAMPHKYIRTGLNGSVQFYYERVNAVTAAIELNAARNNPEQWKRIKAKYPRTLQRGAGNVHFPLSVKAISIPDQSNNGIPIVVTVPESFKNHLQTLFSFVPEFSTLNNETEKVSYLKAKDDNEIIVYFGNIAATIIRQYLNILYPEPVMTVSELQNRKSQLRKDEFDFFINHDNFIPDDFWYKVTHYPGIELDLGFVEQVMLFDKIREIRVLKGFTRVRPLAFEELIYSSNVNEISQNYQNEFNRIQDVRIHHGQHGDNSPATPWLPGIEVKGEGFFIQFNDEILNEWAQNNLIINRIKKLQSNYLKSLKEFGSIPDNLEDEFVNPRYVLLHTLSHILIDAIVADSGYMATALSEIIYCSNTNDGFDMNGILIYTSSPDADGTLGGLVEQGKPENLKRILRIAVEKARWCSSDPLCIETEHGQGFMGVNLAACHSCCMLPETSCENMNKFLDRAVLIGSLTNPEIGFFNHVGYID
jgi:hypothetical protein